MKIRTLALVCLLAGAAPVAALPDPQTEAGAQAEAAASEARAETGGADATADLEPLWVTVLLAPGRVLGHGRFDAAKPSYHVALAEERAAREAARRECACAFQYRDVAR